MASVPQAETLRILSLDGGGIKGYTSLLILKRIFRTIQNEGGLATEPLPCDVFDLITGTSTGGLIAVMLGRLHMTIDECTQQYKVVGEKVFGPQPTALGKVIRAILKTPFYDIKVLQEEVKKLLKSRDISVDAKLLETGPCQCKVVLCVTRVATTKTDVLRNYLSTDATQENYHCKIWEAASATAAAPMYFKNVTFQDSGQRWCDGGLRRNNPINETVAEIHREKEWKQRKVGCILSIGTGVAAMDAVSGDIAGFLKGAIKIMTDSEETADGFATSPLGKELAQSKRYFRFNVPQGLQDLQLDEWKETEKMNAMTTEYLSKVGSGNEVERCAKSLLDPDSNLQEGVSPRPSLLPYSPCPHFVDRIFYAKKLHSFFKTRINDQQIYVLWGLGGAGKTQIALRFAQAMQYRFCVFWIRADSFVNFANDFGEILKRLDPSLYASCLSTDKEGLLQGTLNKLEEISMEWLLILDNVDDVELFESQDGEKQAISQYLPRKGRLLITTRDQRFQGRVAAADHGTQVKPMSDAEALDLLVKSIPPHLRGPTEKHLPHIQVLLKELGNLPLAIAQAAANILEIQWSLDEYTFAYQEKQQRMGLMKAPARDFHTTDARTACQSVAVTWELSFEHLQEKHPLSATLMCYMGSYHWRDIPKSLLLKLPEFQNLKPLAFQEVIRRLLNLSLVDETQEGEWSEYHVHPVVHERISQRLSAQDQIRYLVPSTETVAALFPLLERNGNPDNPVCRYLLPHALHQIEMDEVLNIREKPFVRLMQVVSRYLCRAGFTEISVSLASRALEFCRTIPECDEQFIFEVRKVNLHCLSEDAQYEKADKEAIGLLSQLESEASKLTLSEEEVRFERLVLFDSRDHLCTALGRYEEAEKIQREAIVMVSRSHLAEQLGYHIQFKHNLSNTLWKQGKNLEAKEINDEVLEFAESEDGKHLVSKTTYLAICNLKAHLIRSERTLGGPAARRSESGSLALPIYQRVFTESMAVLGINNIDTWKAANNVLAELFAQQRYFDAARFVQMLFESKSKENVLIQGKFRVTFEITCRNAILALASLPIKRNRSPREPDPSAIQTLLYEAMRTAQLDPMATFKYPDITNAYGVEAQKQGNFVYAEQVHRLALDQTRTYPERSSEDVVDVIHYNIMMAIARQPGRLDEAFLFRQQNMERVLRVEAINGDLTSRLQKIKLDREIYDETVRRLAARETVLGDAWFQENEELLARTELLYGLLEEPQDEAQGGAAATDQVQVSGPKGYMKNFFKK